MLEDMCIKPCSGPIISQGNKWTTGFIFYPTSDTEHYHLVILHEFVVDLKTAEIVLYNILLLVSRLAYLRFPE